MLTQTRYCAGIKGVKDIMLLPSNNCHINRTLAFWHNRVCNSPREVIIVRYYIANSNSKIIRRLVLYGQRNFSKRIKY